VSHLRKTKLESLIQAIIAKFLNEARLRWGVSDLITVDQVFLAADLKSGQIWVSFIPHTKGLAEKNFAVLERHMADIQREVFHQLSIKRVPKLTIKLADPEQSFRLQEIFDTLEGHGNDSGTNSHDPESGKQDPAGNA